MRRDSDTHIPWDSRCIRTAPNHSGGDREYIGDAARDIDPAAPRIVPAAVGTVAAAADRAAADPGIELVASDWSRWAVLRRSTPLATGMCRLQLAGSAVLSLPAPPAWKLAADYRRTGPSLVRMPKRPRQLQGLHSPVTAISLS